MAHRIDTPDSVAGMFSDAAPATVVGDDWLNDMQENVLRLIEGCGVALVKGNYDQFLAACVSTAGGNKIMRRDAGGRAQVASPSADSDIDTQGARNSAITTHNGVTNPHSATAAATASRLVLRDASGRAAFADPSAAGDAATKGYVDGFQGSGTATPGANWSTLGVSSALVRAGKLVFLAWDVIASAGAAWTSILTVPAGFRPPAAKSGYSEMMAIVEDDSTGLEHAAMVTINTSGVVSVNAYDNGTSFVTMFAIGVDDRVRLRLTFDTD